ncbi:MAG: IclR family transcriptional regulator [Acetobacteraceae bacterium]
MARAPCRAGSKLHPAPRARAREAAVPPERVAEPAPRVGVGVFERAFAVLEYVVRAGRPVAPPEIAADLNLPKPTVYRMIEQFESDRILHRQLATRRIAVGPRLVDFAFDILGSSIQYAPRRQILHGLVAEVGETCNIGTLEGNQIQYFDRVEAVHWPLRLHFPIGARVPLTCTAIGKLFLAFLPERRRATLIEQLELRPHTQNTITTLTALEAEIEKIRRDGLSVDREEYLAGVVCLGAPVFNGRGEILAGIAIQAPAARMPIADAYRHRAALLAAARALGESFTTFNSAFAGGAGANRKRPTRQRNPAR